MFLYLQGCNGIRDDSGSQFLYLRLRVATEAGKHALVEKPIDVTLEKADRMITAFRKAGKKLSVISQHRFDPSVVW
ncbi:Gfo/Idh/MocA family oxidoreductase [Paenibacillus hemerocallicola]|uniref:Gfo/Idh/MocA family oxidoreductase n=1 Tax=Paenibacillus hemerocallicola TaxID=1172614 RepID=UPI00159EE41B|nr:Gfo/Idh/MocA family oxidoreductase [Paenibacillus hemerocallicola]